MKRISAATVMMGLVASMAVAATNEVTSVNVVGYYTIEMAPAAAFTLAALQFEAIDPADQTLKGVFGTGQLEANNLPLRASTVYLWNAASNVWESYYQDGNGDFKDKVTRVVSNNKVFPAGKGFFLQSSASLVAPKSIIVTGQVVAAPTVATPVATGFQIVGFPYSTGSSLTDSDLIAQVKAANLALQADKIYLWNKVTGAYDSYWTKGGAEPKWFNTVNRLEEAVNLELGQGFWIEAKNGFTWQESNPYLSSL